MLSLGGPVNLDVSWSLTEKIAVSGPDLINPIMFPATLASGCASAIASLTASHAFAVSVGTNRQAFVEALELAWLLLECGDADEILLVGAMDAGHAMLHAYGNLGRPLPLSVGLAFLVERARPNRACIAVRFVNRRKATGARGLRPEQCVVEDTLLVDGLARSLGPPAAAVRLLQSLQLNVRAQLPVVGGNKRYLEAELLL